RERRPADRLGPRSRLRGYNSDILKWKAERTHLTAKSRSGFEPVLADGPAIVWQSEQSGPGPPSTISRAEAPRRARQGPSQGDFGATTTPTTGPDFKILARPCDRAPAFSRGGSLMVVGRLPGGPAAAARWRACPVRRRGALRAVPLGPA